MSKNSFEICHFMKQSNIDSGKLACFLKKKAESSRNLKVYTSMERALGILVSGDIYLTPGSTWNDEEDFKLM